VQLTCLGQVASNKTYHRSRQLQDAAAKLWLHDRARMLFQIFFDAAIDAIDNPTHSYHCATEDGGQGSVDLIYLVVMV
jgi:hypothetical protein